MDSCCQLPIWARVRPPIRRCDSGGWGGTNVKDHHTRDSKGSCRIGPAALDKTTYQHSAAEIQRRYGPQGMAMFENPDRHTPF
ncbi:hypothetical protein N7468_003364 [Penicillium chermesinum]|uniref:Uncharacterized protein n=1 Tax=Penicillium chermesinum TaxID=63820 RepID=A0A9W9P6I9_9EURO|nr:uncharacterized protein N7468_003364 [Penicillium chermesinum]KAJ5238745.1 hypothetical protein N7468_003364 [Penicillium chermesinum]